MYAIARAIIAGFAVIALFLLGTCVVLIGCKMKDRELKPLDVFVIAFVVWFSVDVGYNLIKFFVSLFS